MRASLLIAGALVLAVGVAESQAQARTWYRPVPRYGMGYGGWGGYGYGTTPAGDAARGYADVIRSQGEYNLNTSAAAINYQEARSKYIDNKLKWQQTYFEIKRLGKENRDAYWAEQREARDKYLASNPQSGPPRMSPSQLDPSTGKLYWPTALQGPEFAASRDKLDELMVLRAHTSSTTSNAMEIRDVARNMQALLKTQIRDMLPNQYLEARKFLESLAFEGQYALGT